MTPYPRILLLISVLLSGSLNAATDSIIEYPKLSDERFQVTLYAEDPDIVTPIGGVVDRQGRFYVIESHTHSPRPDYEGPKGDVIKVFEGERFDGRYESMRVFADGIFQAQSLAFDKDGRLFVVCTREVIVLHDRDGDGYCEDRTRILHLDPYEKRGNPHGQMQGIAFSNDGWLYVATGTTSDDWIGSDGARLSVGPYWGGIIARCKPDGTRLERIAWGFWNPYSLTIDRQGRLLAIDNDPDHRGPNRVLHIVEGGDYGYKRTYGHYGLHPYQAWEGELPGTLPLIAGIGEAPTAIIDANSASFPLDYRDTLIGAAWGEHNLTVYRPAPKGTSITATHEIFLQGQGHDNLTSPFRPSGLAASPIDGDLFISDWMLIDYTTHSKGRIWKVRVKPGVETFSPRAPFAKQESGEGFNRIKDLTSLSKPKDYPKLRRATTDSDPFVRSAALTAMTRPQFRDTVVRDLEHEDPQVRLGALLALRRADVPEPETYIKTGLQDSSLEVAQMALIWAGEKELKTLRADIDSAVSKPGLNRTFFQTWLATMQIMQQPEESGTGNTKSQSNRKLSPIFIEQLVHDRARPIMLRAMATRWLQNPEKPSNHDFLVKAALTADPILRIEAIRRLGDSSHSGAPSVLTKIAHDLSQAPPMRTEALVALARNPELSIVALLKDPEPSVQLEATRALRELGSSPVVQAAATELLESVLEIEEVSRLRSQLEFLTSSETVSRPNSVQEWQDLLSDGGDPDAGRRVFFSANSSCIACHAADGRGGKLGTGTGAGFIALPFGPDLSAIGRTADRNALIRSIVNPSGSIAPEYQGWYVTLKNGETVVGREIDQERNAIQLVTLDGYERDLPRSEIQSWGAMEHSLMPQGLAQSLAVEEFRDLIAFLESQK